MLKGIGCSPVEVTTALSSSDKKRAGEMKETLRQFQMFLVNFEVLYVKPLIIYEFELH